MLPVPLNPVPVVMLAAVNWPPVQLKMLVWLVPVVVDVRRLPLTFSFPPEVRDTLLDSRFGWLVEVPIWRLPVKLALPPDPTVSELLSSAEFGEPSATTKPPAFKVLPLPPPELSTETFNVLLNA